MIEPLPDLLIAPIVRAALADGPEPFDRALRVAA